MEVQLGRLRQRVGVAAHGVPHHAGGRAAEHAVRPLRPLPPIDGPGRVAPGQQHLLRLDDARRQGGNSIDILEFGVIFTCGEATQVYGS